MHARVRRARVGGAEKPGPRRACAGRVWSAVVHSTLPRVAGGCEGGRVHNCTWGGTKCWSWPAVSRCGQAAGAEMCGKRKQDRQPQEPQGHGASFGAVGSVGLTL